MIQISLRTMSNDLTGKTNDNEDEVKTRAIGNMHIRLNKKEEEAEEERIFRSNNIG